MRIGDSSKGAVPSGRNPVRSSNTGSNSSAAGANGTDKAKEAVAAKETQATSAQLQGRAVSGGSGDMSTQLKGLPEVRPDVVADVKKKIQSGELLTPVAAEKAARAILREFASYASSVKVQG